VKSAAASVVRGDATMRAVSAAHPTAEEAAALVSCHQPRDPLLRVTGMGRVANGREALHYIRTTDDQAELRTDEPVWIVTLSGPMLTAGGQKWLDPTCIYFPLSHEAGFIGTGATILPDGRTIPADPDPSPPDRALPTLIAPFPTFVECDTKLVPPPYWCTVGPRGIPLPSAP